MVCAPLQLAPIIHPWLGVVKLSRALMQEDRSLDDPSGDFSRDSDGSAKVALIGVDRSIGAWVRLRDHFPEKEDAILDVLVLLDRIRKRTESDFPGARSFVRPGFDTETIDETTCTIAGG